MLTICDPQPPCRYFGEILTPQHLYEAPLNLTKGILPDKAMERWSTAVTMHLSARFLKSTKYGARVLASESRMLWGQGGGAAGCIGLGGFLQTFYSGGGRRLRRGSNMPHLRRAFAGSPA